LFPKNFLLKIPLQIIMRVVGYSFLHFLDSCPTEKFLLTSLIEVACAVMRKKMKGE
jgi:hypothetical protein